MSTTAGKQDSIRTAELWQPGRLWSLWDMINLKVWRLLEAHEILTVERGFFERAARELERQGKEAVHVDERQYMKLRTAIFDVEQISREAKLVSTQRASARMKYIFEKEEQILDIVLNA